MSEATGPRTKRRWSVHPLSVVAIGPALLGACIVVSMRIGLRFGLGVTPTASAAVIVWAAILLGCFLPRRAAKRRVSEPPSSASGEVFVVVLLLVVSILLWDRGADRSILWPHAWGVDQAHHAALTTFIVDTDGPPRIAPQLGGMSGYPPGAHELAAAVVRLGTLNPFSATWFTGLLAGFLQLWAVAWLALTLSTRAKVLAAVTSCGLWLVGWRIGIGMVTESFFFSQTVTLLFGTVGIGLIARALDGNRRCYVPVAVFAVASLFTYPQAAILIPGALVAVAVPPVWRRLRDVPGWLVTAGGFLTAAVVVLAYLWANKSIGFRSALQGVGEGGLNRLEVATVGGPAVAIVLGIGVAWVLLHSLHEVRLRTLAGAIMAPIIVAAVFLMLRRSGFPIVVYRILKNGQTVFPFLCVAGGLALAHFASQSIGWSDRISIRRATPIVNGLVALSTIATLLFLARSTRLGAGFVPLMDRDAYELARKSAKSIQPDEIALAGDGLSPYTVWWVGLGRTASYEWRPMIPRMTLFESWPTGRPEQYMLVDSTARAKFENRPGVVVVASRGGAALLKRGS